MLFLHVKTIIHNTTTCVIQTYISYMICMHGWVAICITTVERFIVKCIGMLVHCEMHWNADNKVNSDPPLSC